MGLRKTLEEEPQQEEQLPEFFMLDADHFIWPWVLGGFVFLLIEALVTGYFNG